MSKIPQFLRTRIEREIHSAHNPVGMSVHDGRGRFIASDIQYLINIIDEGEAGEAMEFNKIIDALNKAKHDVYEANSKANFVKNQENGNFYVLSREELEKFVELIKNDQK